MSPSDRSPVERIPDRELTDAELESISAAGALKGPPDNPHKNPEPPKNP